VRVKRIKFQLVKLSVCLITGVVVGVS